MPPHVDVVVVGGGPAGSIAALVLARGGARVALVDKAEFPRDKACGDIVGPRGLRLLEELGVPAPTGRNVGEIMVVGPSGRRIWLPCGEGRTYPGHGTAATRTTFDSMLRGQALEAGATAVQARAVEPLMRGRRVEGYRLHTGAELHADFVIGADGATSGVAEAAGMVEADKVLWGFALRAYLRQDVEFPAIVFWESEPWRAVPGYGWVFPGSEGGANVGLGLALRGDRRAGAAVQRMLPRLLDHLCRLGLIVDGGQARGARRLGGWLKMGMVGTRPAAGRVLLVGDAAGLVNPLQGEGIAQAMWSGRSAAEAILAHPADAAGRYRDALAADHLPFHRIAASLQGSLAGRPRVAAVVVRLLTAAAWSNALAGGWSVFWNELLEGAPVNRHRSVAALATRLGDWTTSRSSSARWFDEARRTRAGWCCATEASGV